MHRVLQERVERTELRVVCCRIHANRCVDRLHRVFLPGLLTQSAPLRRNRLEVFQAELGQRLRKRSCGCRSFIQRQRPEHTEIVSIYELENGASVRIMQKLGMNF